MRRALMLAMIVGSAAAAGQAPSRPIVLVIQGGAGVIVSALTPEAEQARRRTLEAALAAGHAVLARGGSSLDAVEQAIVVLEDSPLFNAGRGAVFTRDGANEMDAAIMDGRTSAAGAVASVTTIRNPIRAARAVMEKTTTVQEKAGTVLLVGRGAEAFARDAGLEIVDPSYFRTEERWEQLQHYLADGTTRARAAGDDAFGTVGAVALDRAGNLAAGTSTGGRTGKRPGRVGDSPIPGAGTYADNATCAVSATGTGEYFIRHVVAYDIAARMKYGRVSVKEAAEDVVRHTLAPGDGGVIVLDAHGTFTMPFNSQAMYRGYVRDDGVAHVRIYKDR